jgi:putative sterol carrier protein
MTRAAALADLLSLDDGGVLTQDAIDACAGFVRGASDRDLEAAMTAEGARVLELVLAGMRGSYVGAQEIQAEIVWTLSAGGRPWTQFITRLSQGECTVLRELPAAPRLRLTMEGVTFLRMVTGGVSPLKLFATGQLKTHGDLTFAAGLTKLFRFPTATTLDRRADAGRSASGLRDHSEDGTASANAPSARWFSRRRT